MAHEEDVTSTGLWNRLPTHFKSKIRGMRWTRCFQTAGLSWSFFETQVTGTKVWFVPTGAGTRWLAKLCLQLPGNWHSAPRSHFPIFLIKRSFIFLPPAVYRKVLQYNLNSNYRICSRNLCPPRILRTLIFRGFWIYFCSAYITHHRTVHLPVISLPASKCLCSWHPNMKFHQGRIDQLSIEYLLCSHWL
jgi:hypothetical protein